MDAPSGFIEGKEKYWNIVGKRGSGKTYSACKFIDDFVATTVRTAVIFAPNKDIIRDIIVRQFQELNPLIEYKQNKLLWPNASVAYLYTQDSNEYRGLYPDIVFLEEVNIWVDKKRTAVAGLEATSTKVIVTAT